MGTVENNKSATVTFRMPEFSPTLELEWECDVLDDMSNTPYDMIIGQDAMKVLKMDIHVLSICI